MRCVKTFYINGPTNTNVLWKLRERASINVSMNEQRSHTNTYVVMTCEINGMQSFKTLHTRIRRQCPEPEQRRIRRHCPEPEQTRIQRQCPEHTRTARCCAILSVLRCWQETWLRPQRNSDCLMLS